MSDFDLQPRSFPDRIAGLGFSVELPADWVAHELPEEPLRFEDPSYFVPLAVVVAPHAVLVWAAAARPAFDEGSVLAWAGFLNQQGGFAVQAQTQRALGDRQAIVGLSSQASELGPMTVRYAFFEDGGRLVHVSLSCPAPFAGLVEPVWRATLASFRLAEPRGPTAPVLPPPAPGDDPRVVQHHTPPEPAAPPPEPAPQGEGPAWWQAACALEAADALEAAEAAIQAGERSLGAMLQTAELYRRRKMRLLDAGDTDGARAAHLKSADWASGYACGATSGGEAAANRIVVQDFLAKLGPAP